MLVATSMSKFAQTFCTSSRSSIVSSSLKSASASLPAICTVFFGTIASSASTISTPLFFSAVCTAWKSVGPVETRKRSSSRCHVLGAGVERAPP